MSPEDLDLLEATVTMVRPRGAEIAADFYRRLFDRLPEARVLFADDLTDQSAKFFATLTEIAGSLRDLASVSAPARDLGARHRTYGVQAAHYPVVGEVLIETLADALGEDFSPAHRAAWSAAYDLMSELMQLGASPPAARPRLGDRTR